MRWYLTQRSSQAVSCQRISLWSRNNRPSLNGSYKLRAWFHVYQLIPSKLSNSPFRYSISSMIFSSLPFLPIPKSRRLLRAKRRISFQFSPLEKMIPDQNKTIWQWATQQKMITQGVKHILSLDLWDIYQYKYTNTACILWQINIWQSFHKWLVMNLFYTFCHQILLVTYIYTHLSHSMHIFKPAVNNFHY